MTLTRQERENLVIALRFDGLNRDQARNLHPSPPERYAWQTVNRTMTWLETLPVEEAQHLQDERVRFLYERLHGVDLAGADGASGIGLAGYLRDVRREIAALSTEALEEGLRRREKYAEFERKRSPWPPAIFMPFQRSWSLRGGAQALFIAEHCPQLVEAYDAFGEEEATIYQIFRDELTRPSNGTNGRNAINAAERRYEAKKKLLLAVLDRLCEAKELPGECPFCPDHTI